MNNTSINVTIPSTNTPLEVEIVGGGNTHIHDNKAILDLTTASYTNTKDTKLSGIAENANNYVHPLQHDASMITQDSTHRFVTDDNITTWSNASGGNHTHDNKIILDAITASYTTEEKNKLSGLSNYTHPLSHPASMITTDSTNRFVTDTQVSTWDAKTDVDDVQSMLSGTVGLPPETLNTIEKVASAIGNDPYFFTNIGSEIDGKADVNHTHTGIYSPVDHTHTDLHTHSNKTLLDNLTSSGDGTQYLANDGTYKTVTSGDNHTHTNKAILDATTASYTTSDAIKVAGCAPIASPNFTGTPTAPAGTDYTTARIRNAYFSTAVPVSMTNNGDICFVYE